ncbi:MAG: biotin--[acetyl-CoA-carboxylase] ligase [Saprospiraceae bacterium]
MHPENNMVVGKVVRPLERVSSTNDAAAAWLRELPAPPDGSLVWALEQSAGRGRRGNHWQADPGTNFTGSYLLYPTRLAVDEQFDLSRAVSLAAADCAAELSGAPTTVKWPNDVFIGNRKVGGILIETQLKGAFLASAVVGIGLNVNQLRFPEEIVDRATSLALVAGHTYELEEVIATLSRCLDGWYLRLKTDPAGLRAAYRERLFGYGKEREFIRRADSQLFHATVTGTRPDGNILLEGTGGEMMFNLDELAWCYE